MKDEKQNFDLLVRYEGKEKITHQDLILFSNARESVDNQKNKKSGSINSIKKGKSAKNQKAKNTATPTPTPTPTPTTTPASTEKKEFGTCGRCKAHNRHKTEDCRSNYCKICG